MRYFTNIEQSKNLMDLGLSPETADMYYSLGSSTCIPIDITPLKDGDIPAWSVTSIIDLFPKIGNEYPKVKRKLNGKYVSYSDVAKVMTEEHDLLIDSVVDMLEWCLIKHKV